jgi:hypothetical protein
VVARCVRKRPDDLPSLVDAIGGRRSCAGESGVPCVTQSQPCCSPVSFCFRHAQYGIQMVINGKTEIIGEFLEFEKTSGLQVNCSPRVITVNKTVFTIETGSSSRTWRLIVYDWLPLGTVLGPKRDLSLLPRTRSVQRPGRCRVRELIDRIDNPTPDRHAGGITSGRELTGPSSAFPQEPYRRSA